MEDMSVISAPGFAENYSVENSESHGELGKILVHHLYENYDAFIMILTKAQGSRFECCVDELIELIEKSYRKMACIFPMPMPKSMT